MAATAKSRSRSRSSAKLRSKKAGRSRRGPSARGRANPNGSRRGPGTIRRAGAGVARHLSPRATEAVGIGLLLLGVLSALALWFGTGGPFGRALVVAVKGLVGPAGFVLPVLATYWAVLLLK